MEGSKTLLSSSKFSWARDRVPSKFKNLARSLKNVQQPYFRETEGQVTKLVSFPHYQRLSRNSSFEKTENEMRG
jgi:hypothetical protein